MFQIIPQENRFFSDMGNMNSYFLLSFAHYYDPQNESFGNLRVFNDDFLSPKSGFPLHPHKYYEIMTIVLEGTITHKDSLGNHMKIGKHQIQVTDTSTGILHSEFNEESQDLQLYQVWFSPDEMSRKPSYYTASFSPSDFENQLFSMASGISKNVHTLSSKVEVQRGIFEGGKTVSLNWEKYVFVYIRSGKAQINAGEILSSNDQFRAYQEKEIQLEFLQPTELLVILSE